MNVKNALLVAAFGGACLVTSASAFPIANMPRETTTIQIQDDEGGEMARRIIRGVEGGGGYRNHGHDRGSDDRGSYRHRNHDRRHGWEHRDNRERERGARRFHHDD